MSRILFSKLANTFKDIKNPDFNPEVIDGIQQIRQDLAGIENGIRTPLIERVMNVKDGLNIIHNDIKQQFQQRLEPIQQGIESLDRRVLSDLTGKIGSLISDTNLICPPGYVVGTDGQCHAALPPKLPDCPPGSTRLPSGDCAIDSGGGIIGGGGGGSEFKISCKEGEHLGGNVWYWYLGFNAQWTALCQSLQSAEDCNKPETHPTFILPPWNTLAYYMEQTKLAQRYDCWIGPFLTLFESADQGSRFWKDFDPANPLCFGSGGGGGGGGGIDDGKKEDCCKQVCPPPIVNITNKIECPPSEDKKPPDSGDEKCPDANEYEWLTESCAVESYEIMLKRMGFDPKDIKLPDGVEYSLEEYQQVLMLTESD